MCELTVGEPSKKVNEHKRQDDHVMRMNVCRLNAAFIPLFNCTIKEMVMNLIAWSPGSLNDLL